MWPQTNTPDSRGSSRIRNNNHSESDRRHQSAAGRDRPRCSRSGRISIGILRWALFCPIPLLPKPNERDSIMRRKTVRFLDLHSAYSPSRSDVAEAAHFRTFVLASFRLASFLPLGTRAHMYAVCRPPGIGSALGNALAKADAASSGRGGDELVTAGATTAHTTTAQLYLWPAEGRR